MPPEIPENDVKSNTVRLFWESPPMPNGIITGYQVNVEVITPLQSSSNRKKRQTATSVHPSCIPENGTGVISVSLITSLDLNTGKIE